METAAPQGPFCQSCGMPLQAPQDHGTNENGSINDEYCRFCYQGGHFTEPDISMERMIDKMSDITSHVRHMPLDEAHDLVMGYMPKLQRWRRAQAA